MEDLVREEGLPEPAGTNDLLMLGHLGVFGGLLLCLMRAG